MALWAEEAEILALEAEASACSSQEGVLATVPDQEAVAQARRLAKLKETLAELRGLGAPAAANLVDSEVHKIEKAARCAGREDQANSKAVLRAYVGKSLDAERALVQSKQRAALHKRKMAGIVNAKKKKVARKKSFAAKAKAALKAKIETLPKTFTAAMCGAPAPGGLAARVLCLERLKLHAPELDFEREHTWKFLKGEIAKEKFFLKCVGLTGKGRVHWS